MKLLSLAAALGLMASTASATTIAELDLSGVSFTSTLEGPSDPIAFFNIFYEASGVSNGIGYKLTSQSIRDDLSVMQSFNGMPTGNNSFDDLHVDTKSWSVSFDTPIQSLLFLMANDEAAPESTANTSLIDLGITASDTTGMTPGAGTQYFITDTSGAFALYEFATPVTTVTSTWTEVTNDNFDLVFFANVPVNGSVPLPASGTLMLAGLVALAMIRRRRG